MECRDYERRRERMARGSCAVGLQLNFSGVPGRTARKPARAALQPPAALGPRHYAAPDVSCISDMDEISYWIHTKRAPCLMNYDNIIKKQNDQAQCSNIDLTLATETELSPRKNKRKRKVPLLEESLSSGQQQNVYFDAPQKTPVNNHKADSDGSDLDFNLKNTVKNNVKRRRLQKTKSLFQKKSRVVTSTPKGNVNLRRSVRQAQLHNTHGNNSFEIFGATNGVVEHNVVETEPQQAETVHKPDAQEQATNNQAHNSRRVRPRNTTHYYTLSEDFSDVSGFTANYIRSTKVQSNNKTLRKSSCKPARHLPNSKMQSNTICVNKVDTSPEPKILNCSTDSSHNVINCDTPKPGNPKLEKSDQCVDTKNKTKPKPGRKAKIHLNVSFQSQSSGTSRYPKRQRNHINSLAEMPSVQSNKSCLDYSSTDKKEVSRTRRGRSAALNSQRESVLMVSNEQMNSRLTPNETSPDIKGRSKPQPQLFTRKVHRRRDKSGFTACFSESDDDSVPLIQKKFFCA